jgi:hypothetical protein
MLMHLYAAILAQATNLGPTAMARSSGLSYDQIAHATAWYLRDETLTPAIDVVVTITTGSRQPGCGVTGTFSSSDGQRFPVLVKATNAGALPRYFGFGRGLSVLSWVADHYATFGTKVIPSGVREGLFALDEIFALRDRDSQRATSPDQTASENTDPLLRRRPSSPPRCWLATTAGWPANPWPRRPGSPTGRALRGTSPG